jgi:glucan phosphorylase
MKTRTFLLSAILALCWLPSAAQTKYYNTTKTFYESGYTYQADVEGKHVRLYNKANKWTYEPQRDKATGQTVNVEPLLPVLADDYWTRPKCFDIVDRAFTYEQALRV